jgi:hypothetical protein
MGALKSGFSAWPLLSMILCVWTLGPRASGTPKDKESREIPDWR